MTVIALIVAAGRGTRLGGDRPKQYRLLGGKAMLRHGVEAFLTDPQVDATYVVIHPDDRALYDEAVAGLSLPPPILGGARRQDSVLKGLETLPGTPDTRVLIHDAARPFVSSRLIGAVLEGLDRAPAAIPALPLADTLKRAQGGYVSETLPREGLYRAQTPQGFHLSALLDAHRRAGAADVTDDAALMEKTGHAVALVEGEEAAFKVTTKDDFRRAEIMLGHNRETRVGSGFDVHRFTAGDHIMLCGLAIPHAFGLEGHSDADVGLHAIVDAILGALAEGDIGQHFPPSDPRWKDAPSRLFLAEAAARVKARGGRILHIDLTVLCEAPRIGPYREAMAESVAAILGLSPRRVAIKATTTEKLGFTGRREGIAAQAVATLELPAGDDF
jgi:2-C-methyl-D-erythritol 4-phosphate cytidylyltransferase/2-C-methyl-D-erythritol 2,4-cyclodiphosphate synthase